LSKIANAAVKNAPKALVAGLFLYGTGKVYQFNERVGGLERGRADDVIRIASMETRHKDEIDALVKDHGKEIQAARLEGQNETKVVFLAEMEPLRGELTAMRSQMKKMGEENASSIKTLKTEMASIQTRNNALKSQAKKHTDQIVHYKRTNGGLEERLRAGKASTKRKDDAIKGLQGKFSAQHETLKFTVRQLTKACSIGGPEGIRIAAALSRILGTKLDGTTGSNVNLKMIATSSTLSETDGNGGDEVARSLTTDANQEGLVGGTY